MRVERCRARIKNLQGGRELSLFLAILGRRRRAETAEVVGDGVLVPRRHGEGIGAADLAGMLVVHVAAQLKLERVHTAQQSLVKLLDHRRIPGESAEIEVLHRRDQILDLTLHLRIVGDLFEAGSSVQSLLNRR